MYTTNSFKKKYFFIIGKSQTNGFSAFVYICSLKAMFSDEDTTYSLLNASMTII